MAGLAFGIGKMLSNYGQNLGQTQRDNQLLDIQKQQLELEKQAQAANIKSTTLQQQMALSQYLQQQADTQNFQHGRDNFVKSIMTDPSMASLRPLAPLIGQMDPKDVGGFVKDYTAQMQKKNDQQATQKAYEMMKVRETDPRKAAAWGAAAMMAGMGSSAAEIAPVLKSANITADDGQEALRHAQAALAEANADLAKMQAKFLAAQPIPGAPGSASSGMPSGLPPLPPGIIPGGTFPGGTTP